MSATTYLVAGNFNSYVYKNCESVIKFWLTHRLGKTGFVYNRPQPQKIIIDPNTINSLAILNTHKDRTDHLNLKDVANEFVGRMQRYSKATLRAIFPKLITAKSSVR